MPRVRRALKPRRRHARRPAKKSASKRGDTAHIHEVVEFNDVNANQVQGLNFSLFQFPRASELAPNFKWYRASKVEWYIDPNYNVFAEGAVGGIANGSTSVPYLYHRMNRNQDGFNYTIRNLQAMGAKPVKFTKQLKFIYKPNWCSPGLSSYVTSEGNGTAITNLRQQGLTPQYGWLMSTDKRPIDTTGNEVNLVTSDLQGNFSLFAPPSTAGMTAVSTNAPLYNGSDIFIDQFDSQVGTVLGRVTCKVTWEFKEPNFALDEESQSGLKLVNENGSAAVAAISSQFNIATAGETDDSRVFHFGKTVMN